MKPPPTLICSIQCVLEPDDTVELLGRATDEFVYLDVRIEDYEIGTNSQIELGKATAMQLGEALLKFARS